MKISNYPFSNFSKLNELIIYVKLPEEVNIEVLGHIFDQIVEYIENSNKNGIENNKIILFDLEKVIKRPKVDEREFGSSKINQLENVDSIIFLTHKNKIVNTFLSYILSKFVKKPYYVFNSHEEAILFIKKKYKIED